MAEGPNFWGNLLAESRWQTAIIVQGDSSIVDVSTKMERANGGKRLMRYVAFACIVRKDVRNARVFQTMF